MSFTLSKRCIYNLCEIILKLFQHKLEQHRAITEGQKHWHECFKKYFLKHKYCILTATWEGGVMFYILGSDSSLFHGKSLYTCTLTQSVIYTIVQLIDITNTEI